jgi:hypothetical protein
MKTYSFFFFLLVAALAGSCGLGKAGKSGRLQSFLPSLLQDVSAEVPDTPTPRETAPFVNVYSTPRRYSKTASTPESQPAALTN